MSKDRYSASITNIRDTVKWLIGSIGAVFITLLAGIQFNDVPFATSVVAASAGIAAALSIMITFGLALATLVGGGLSFRDLATKWRYRRTRRFINRVWADPPGTPQFERFWAMLQKKDGELRERKITRTNAYYVSINALADELLWLGKWHIVRSRFNRLVLAMMLLIPIELAAAGIMFAQPEEASDDTTITIKLNQRR